MQGAVVLLGLAAGSMVFVVSRQSAAPAVPAPFNSTPSLTWNMQGATGDAGNNWDVVRAYMRHVQVAMLQEVGPGPPRGGRHELTDLPPLTINGNAVTRQAWLPDGTERGIPYRVHYVRTDTNGGRTTDGRVNTAIVSLEDPDEVQVVVNPHQRGRVSLGVRFDDDWYFSFHGLAGSHGSDSAEMVAEINRQVNSWGATAGRNYHWTIGADFNRRPRELRASAGFPAHATTYATGLPTHTSGNELDYLVSSRSIQPMPSRFLLDRRGSDHNAVQVGGIRARAETEDLEFDIMGLGDSLTHGTGSSHGAGYRKGFAETVTSAVLGFLTLAGLTFLGKRSVNMVGSQSSGNIEDAQHEGVPGDRIDQIAARAAASVPAHRPNVVLLHAGTNDLNGNHQVGTAPARLDALVDQILGHSPGVTLIVATLVPARSPELQARIDTYNQAVRGIVERRRGSGQKVALADMGAYLSADDVHQDGLHLHDAGYDRMADVFASALMQAVHDQWITPPAGRGSGGPSSPGRVNIGANARPCSRFGGWAPRGQVAWGQGTNTGSPASPTVGFADLDGDGRDEYLTVDRRFDGAVSVWWNAGPSAGRDGWVWHPKGQLASGTGTQVAFADLTGDGRDDYLQVDPGTGRVEMWWNRGPHANGGWWWEPVGQVADGTGPNTRFGDLNGDGRDDYLQIDPGSGAVRVWWNAGPVGPNPGPGGGWHWTEERQPVASGVAPSSSVRIEDVNGDAFDDYLVVRDDSSVDAWIRTGPGVDQWQPVGQVAAGVGVSPAMVRLVDLDSDRKVDYLALDNLGNANGWLNDCGSHGTPGAMCANHNDWRDLGQVAAGTNEVFPSVPNTPVVRFADLDGDGRDDYLLVSRQTGSVKTWWNAGPLAGPTGWDWHPKGVHADGVGRHVQFADITGDGRDDYLLVDPTNGRTEMWWNRGPHANGSWWWEPVGQIADGTGANTRFGDLDGDGRDDYLQVDPGTGAVDVWWNAGSPTGGDPAAGAGWRWQPKGRLASGVSPGEWVRFEDIDGDRDDDYLVIGQDSSVQAWLSGGPGNAEVPWIWHPIGAVAEGVGANPRAVQLINLNEDRRADYLVLDDRGRAEGWLNTCH